LPAFKASTALWGGAADVSKAPKLEMGGFMGFLQNPILVMGLGIFLAIIVVVAYFFLKSRGYSLGMFMGSE